jgi:hypothetical protein
VTFCAVLGPEVVGGVGTVVDVVLVDASVVGVVLVLVLVLVGVDTLSPEPPPHAASAKAPNAAAASPRVPFER